MKPFAILAILLALPAPRASAQPMDTNAVLALNESEGPVYRDVALKIWSFAEVGYQETRSSALLQEQLKAAGFVMATGVAEIPTAFTATWGSGKPVIGIIGEFDALPGLSPPSPIAAPWSRMAPATAADIISSALPPRLPPSR